MDEHEEDEWAQQRRWLKRMAARYGAALMVGLAIMDLIKWGRRLYLLIVELEEGD